jgi:hypothetical protein
MVALLGQTRSSACEEKQMDKSESRSSGKSVDRFLLSLDEGTFGALYRFLIGFTTIPAMRLLLGGDGSDWMLIPFLLLVLVLLRVVLAVVRKVLPFSAELLEAWYVRRRMAKAYDSYQWRKLIWIGSGLASYVVISGRHRPVYIALSIFCLVAGAAAAARWHALAADNKRPKPTARKIKIAAAQYP